MYPLCQNRLRYQPSYCILTIETLCCLIFRTSKNDSVAGGANNGKMKVTSVRLANYVLLKTLFLLYQIFYWETHA